MPALKLTWSIALTLVIPLAATAATPAWMGDANSTVQIGSSVQYGGFITTPDALEPSLPCCGSFYGTHIASDGGRQLYGTYLDGFLTLIKPGVAVTSGPITAILNAASLSQAGYVAPGEIVAVFGNAIGPDQPVSYRLDSTCKLPSSLNGVQVTFDGIPAPVLYASCNQINLVVPFSLSPQRNPVLATTAMQIQNPASSAVLTATIQQVASLPGVFGFNGNGLIVNQDGTLNSSGNPARRGSIISVYVTGLDPRTPLPLDGVFSRAAIPQTAGSAPFELEGLEQITILLPADQTFASLSVQTVFEQ